MNWDSTGTNAKVVNAFNDYKDFVFRIATLYAGTRLIETVDMGALGQSFKLPLSNDFDEVMTTIRASRTTVPAPAISLFSRPWCVRPLR